MLGCMCIVLPLPGVGPGLSDQIPRHVSCSPVPCGRLALRCWCVVSVGTPTLLKTRTNNYNYFSLLILGVRIAAHVQA